MRGFDPYGRSTLWGIRGACPPAAIFSNAGSSHYGVEPPRRRAPPPNEPPRHSPLVGEGLGVRGEPVPRALLTDHPPALENTS